MYALYSLTLILTVTFGNGTAKKISGKIKDKVYNKNINDVTINIDAEEFLCAGNQYRFTYDVDGASKDEADIVFESLDPDILKVSGSVLYTYNSFEGEEAEAKIKITSKRDADFEKTVTLKLKKFYPEEFKVYYLAEGSGYNKKTIEVGMAVYPYSHTTEKGKINKYELIVDEEYFTYDEKKGAYIAIKETEEGKSVTFKVCYPNGTVGESEPISIIPYVGINDFDEIKSEGKTIENLTLNVNQYIVPILYKDGKSVNTVVDISYTDPDGVIVGNTGYYAFKKAGNYTFTFTLPNGFSKSVNITVNNVMALPELADPGVMVDGIIKVTNGKNTTVQLTYPEGTTFTSAVYECNNDSVSINGGWRSFTVVPNKLGTTTVTVILDDGYQRLEKTYLVQVVEGVILKDSVVKFIDNFVSKFMGHTIFFGMLAVFALNMFKYLEIRNKIKRFVLYIMTALPWAVLTEVIQKFIPTRFGRAEDVIIDMCGFMIGTTLTLIVRFAIRKGKSKPNFVN